jgi:uncharacterized damage-inducible protein DinB
MLNYTRATTISAVQGLSQSELDHPHDPTANPIGALLAHICAIEWSYVASTLGGSPPSAADWAEWGPLMRLGPQAWAAARGRTLEEHLARLEAVRSQTLTGLRAVDDAWLSQGANLPWFRDPVTHLWVWYHVMEDELNHRGQIRWLRGRLPAHGLQAEPAMPGSGAD